MVVGMAAVGIAGVLSMETLNAPEPTQEDDEDPTEPSDGTLSPRDSHPLLSIAPARTMTQDSRRM